MKLSNIKVVGAVIIVILAGFFLYGIIALATSGTSEPLDPTVQAPRERVDYIISDEFKSLPVEKKRKYLEKMRKEGEPSFGPGPMGGKIDDLTPEERHKMHENMRPVFHQHMKEQVDGYFALKTPEEKIAYLDKIIDEREKRHEEMRKRMESLSDSEKEEIKKRFEKRRGQGPPPRPSLSHMKEHIESTDPEERAKFTEFHLAMRARSEQTGKGHRGGPGGPGGPPPH